MVHMSKLEIATCFVVGCPMVIPWLGVPPHSKSNKETPKFTKFSCFIWEKGNHRNIIYVKALFFLDMGPAPLSNLVHLFFSWRDSCSPPRNMATYSVFCSDMVGLLREDLATYPISTANFASVQGTHTSTCLRRGKSSKNCKWCGWCCEIFPEHELRWKVSQVFFGKSGFIYMHINWFISPDFWTNSSII